MFKLKIATPQAMIVLNVVVAERVPKSAKSAYVNKKKLTNKLINAIGIESSASENTNTKNYALTLLSDDY